MFDAGWIWLDNNPAERVLRGVAVGRKNYLFAGSDRGAERAAAFYSLIETAKLNGLDTEAYLRDVLTRIAEHPNRRLRDLLPWNWTPLKPPDTQGPSPSAYDLRADEAAALGRTTLHLFRVYPQVGTIRPDLCGALVMSTETTSAIIERRIRFQNTTFYRDTPGRTTSAVPLWPFGKR